MNVEKLIKQMDEREKKSNLIDIDIYLLTEIGLTPGGSSTVTHLHTNNIQKNTTNLGRVRAVPRLCEL